MATLDARYTINGLVRTDQPVWDNIEKMAEACATWVTYDTHAGKYAVIINNAGNSIQSLTEADIIGPIQISGSDLTNLYNAIEIEYPSSEIKDQPYYYRLELPSSLRNAYEPDNTLQVTSEFINNQVQATLVANITLRQSRLDKTVTINTDYTKINLQAGDIIDITSDTYGWENKEFRIMRVREVEGDDGSLRLEFQCLEYDDEVYDENDISEFLLDGAPGIRAIGSIGTPATPTVALTVLDSLPAQAVTSTVPAGVIDRVQFWAGNVSITGNVANTDYNLIGTVASTDAESFTEGANVTFTTASLRNGTWVWKARGVNSLGTGGFSNTSANVNFVRNQAPDVVIDTTPVVYGNGTQISANLTSYVGDIIANTPGGAVYYDTIGIQTFNSTNASNVALGAGIYIWQRSWTFNVDIPSDGAVALVDINGGVDSSFYDNNYPINRVIWSELWNDTSNTYINGSSSNSDPYEDLNYMVNITTTGSITLRLKVGVEITTGDPYTADPSILLIKKP